MLFKIACSKWVAWNMFMEVITWYVRVDDLIADAYIRAITSRVTLEGLFINETYILVPNY